MTPIDCHPRPTPDRDIQKRQKTKEEPECDFTGLFFSILNGEDSPSETVEQLLCDSDLIFTISSIEDFPKVVNQFVRFLLDKKIDRQKAIHCCEILEGFYGSALNTTPLRDELMGILRNFEHLQKLADEGALKAKHRNLRRASLPQKLRILSEINQLKPFLDQSHNSKLFCLAHFWMDNEELEEGFRDKLATFFYNVNEVKDWVTSSSDYCPGFFAEEKMNIDESSPLGELSDFSLPLLEALGEALAANERNKTANEAFEEIFRDVEDFEWMDLLKLVLGQYPQNSRKELCEKLYPHRHNILDTIGMDPSIQGIIQGSESVAMVNICKEAFKDLQISVNKNKVSISWRVSPP